MNIYWVIIEVNFNKPMSSEGNPDTLGFFQTFGCTESSEETMKDTINSYLNKEVWVEAYALSIDFDVSVIEHNDVEREVLMDEEINESITSSPFNNGIWYKSGKAFFHGEKNNHEHYIVEVAPKDVQ